MTSNGLQIDCVEALALYLCIEARKAEKSNIWKFLKVLPKDFGTLLENWDDKFHQLLPSYMAQAFESAKEQRDIKFEKIDGFYNFRMFGRACSWICGATVCDRFIRFYFDVLETSLRLGFNFNLLIENLYL